MKSSTLVNADCNIQWDSAVHLIQPEIPRHLSIRNNNFTYLATKLELETLHILSASSFAAKFTNAIWKFPPPSKILSLKEKYTKKSTRKRILVKSNDCHKTLKTHTFLSKISVCTLTPHPGAATFRVTMATNSCWWNTFRTNDAYLNDQKIRRAGCEAISIYPQVLAGAIAGQ